MWPINVDIKIPEKVLVFEFWKYVSITLVRWHLQAVIWGPNVSGIQNL